MALYVGNTRVAPIVKAIDNNIYYKKVPISDGEGEVIVNYYINGSQEIAYNGWNISKYYLLKQGSKYAINISTSQWSSVYDLNKNFKSGLGAIWRSNSLFTYLEPTEDCYVRFSDSANTINNLNLREIHAGDFIEVEEW